jgi:hypothetical protein
VAVAAAKTRAEHEEPALVRCPSCLGLRSIAFRNRDTAALCPDCRRGEVVPRETYYVWWLERFSAEECAVMARSIWGPDVIARA